MQAKDIAVGDTLVGPTGQVVYTVKKIEQTAGTVRAIVTYRVDGGDDIRAWDPDTEIDYMTRPEPTTPEV